MSGINYSEKIPNNVNLTNDRTLQRALEHWQPKFLDWWRGMGPTDFQSADVYLRTGCRWNRCWAPYALKIPIPLVISSLTSRRAQDRVRRRHVPAGLAAVPPRYRRRCAASS